MIGLARWTLSRRPRTNASAGGVPSGNSLMAAPCPLPAASRRHEVPAHPRRRCHIAAPRRTIPCTGPPRPTQFHGSTQYHAHRPAPFLPTDQNVPSPPHDADMAPAEPAQVHEYGHQRRRLHERASGIGRREKMVMPSPQTNKCCPSRTRTSRQKCPMSKTKLGACGPA